METQRRHIETRSNLFSVLLPDQAGKFACPRRLRQGQALLKTLALNLHQTNATAIKIQQCHSVCPPGQSLFRPLSEFPEALTSDFTDACRQLNTGPLVVTDDLVTKGVALYLERFYCQPCPLLSNLKAGCSTLPPSIVLYSLLALSLQTSPEESRAGSQTCHTLAGRAWELIADAYGSTNVDEAYLEAVCLMAQRDFASRLHLDRLCISPAHRGLHSRKHLQSQNTNRSRLSRCTNHWRLQDAIAA